ncbi:TRAP transporter small permease subunit [Salipiger mangrovisoli]|uniref:TRAP transporter small permease protein n=1 Tax=Salipiger mangrovisoli TaxID=2865933 RepID=A0ABR9X5F5_9RHOB|nr:TRAP transporter small permease subunit [Salipiger mangrovisoli]
MARGCGWLLLLLIVVILYDVFGRRFFDTGSFKLQELEWHIHGAIAVLCFGWAYICNAHVQIDLFASKMTSATRLKIELACIVFLLIPFMLFLIWFGTDFAHRAYIRGEGSPGGMGLPNRWIIKAAIPIGAALTILGSVTVALRCIVALRRPDLIKTPWLETL